MTVQTAWTPPTQRETMPSMPEWISTREAAAVLGVSESSVYRSLRDEQVRDVRWGEEGVGWRRKPLSARGIYQVSRQRAEELAGGEA